MEEHRDGDRDRDSDSRCLQSLVECLQKQTDMDRRQVQRLEEVRGGWTFLVDTVHSVLQYILVFLHLFTSLSPPLCSLLSNIISNKLFLVVTLLHPSPTIHHPSCVLQVKEDLEEALKDVSQQAAGEISTLRSNVINKHLETSSLLSFRCTLPF